MPYPMNETQYTTLVEELGRLDGEIKGMATKNGEGRFWKLLQIATSVLLTAVTIIVVPFGIWTVQSIHSQEMKMVDFESWKNQGPRFTSTDAERLRLMTKDEIRNEISAKLNKMDDRLESMTRDISEIKVTLKTGK
jgi:hypothetical protein